MFLVLEGIDGCGKSTQAKLLAAELERRGRQVLHLHEPGGTPLGETIRELILNSGSKIGIHSRAEALLYSAARAELVHDVLRPALAEGRWVVCERYYYSTLAYQGYGLGEDTGLLHSLSAYATEAVKPKRVVLLDLDPGEALKRAGRSLDRIESRGTGYMQKVREGYFLLSRREPERFRIVKAGGSEEEVQRAVLGALEDVLP
jgi:dTMP kinase